MKKDAIYSSKIIEDIYKKEIASKNEVLQKKTINIKRAFGNFYIDVQTYFSISGEENLKYKYVGYGGVCFLGNINGKVVTQGLYYKTQEIKTEIENLIISMDLINTEVRETIDYVHEQHGQPNVQHAVLYYNAQNK
jgi:hypothetical protein